MKLSLVALALFAPALASASDVFVNVNAGMFKASGFFYDGAQFSFGGKIGKRLDPVGTFSQLDLALAANHSSSSPVGSLSTATTEVMAQALFTDVSGTHFYFGPQAGAALAKLASDTSAPFAYGALAGYALPLSESLALAPEAHVTRWNILSEAQTVVKVLLGLTARL